MSSTYAELLTETEPARIETDGEYASALKRLGDLTGKGNRRTRDETKLMRLLMLIVEDYDKRHGLPPEDWTPAERLRFLMEQSGRANSDLVPIFGQRSHVSEALAGKRPISAEQARKLGAMFSLTPGFFI